MLVIGIGSDVNRAIHPKEKARLQPGPERPGGPRLQTDSHFNSCDKHNK